MKLGRIVWHVVNLVGAVLIAALGLPLGLVMMIAGWVLRIVIGLAVAYLGFVMILTPIFSLMWLHNHHNAHAGREALRGWGVLAAVSVATFLCFEVKEAFDRWQAKRRVARLRLALPDARFAG